MQKRAFYYLIKSFNSQTLFEMPAAIAGFTRKVLCIRIWFLRHNEIGKPDARWQFSPNQTATQINPMFSRADLGASLLKRIIAK